MDRLALMDIAKIGPGIWFKIHSDGIAATTQSLKESFVININVLCDGFKCKHCQPHFRKYIDEHPIEKYFNIKNKNGKDIGIFQWTWEFHNEVNLRLGKYQCKLEEAYEYYTNNTIGVCHECGQNKEISIKDVNNNNNNNKISNIIKDNNRISTTKKSDILIDTNKTVIVKYEPPEDVNQYKFKPYTFKSTQISTDKQNFPFKMYNK